MTRPLTHVEPRAQFRARIKALADAEWNALESETDPVIHARRHLAEMPAHERTRLQQEWGA